VSREVVNSGAASAATKDAEGGGDGKVWT